MLSPFSKKFIHIMAALCLGYTAVAGVTLPSVNLKPVPGTVTLTFDDGPSPVFTPQILDILKRYHVHAVFFVMAGIAKQHPDIIKRIQAEGHIVASHTVWHDMLSRMSEKKLNYEIGHSQEILQHITGKACVCLRPPYFATNSKVKAVIQHYGMHQILGYMTGDYLRMGVQKLTRHVVQQAHSGQVFVLHDGYKGREQTVAALPGIIEGIKQKGLSFSLICNTSTASSPT